MNIKELQKEKILCRKSDKIRSQALGNIIDLAKKIAKEDNREATEQDIITASKRNNKALNKVVNDIMKEMGIRRNDPILSIYMEEIKVIEEFLPKTLSEEETKKIILDIINNLPENQINIGKIMGILKNQYKDTIDGRIASGIVKEVIK